ncbi:MAG: 3-hydroxyacyl-CoA dehydrogenase family protein, partial [Candidatus Binatia bacterium]
FLRSSQLLSRLAKDNPRFYVDQKPNPKIYDLADAQGKSLDDENVKRALMTSMLVAAARVTELGETPATVDLVATEGIKMPQPPLKLIDATGAAALRDELEETNRMLGQNPLAIPAILAETTGGNKTFYPRI